MNTNLKENRENHANPLSDFVLKRPGAKSDFLGPQAAFTGLQEYSPDVLNMYFAILTAPDAVYLLDDEHKCLMYAGTSVE